MLKRGPTSSTTPPWRLQTCFQNSPREASHDIIPPTIREASNPQPRHGCGMGPELRPLVRMGGWGGLEGSKR
eukprot:9065254-Pyramimonas_sp.AAC.1